MYPNQPPVTPPPPLYAYPPPPPEPRRRRSGAFWAMVIGGSLLAAITVLGLLTWIAVKAVDSDSSTTTALTSGKQIGVIEVSGVLLNAEQLETQLRKFGDDDDVKAIILHINSPGGGAAVSQELYNEVLRVRSEKHKKIVASIETVGASGAYYIASACDKIYANDASVVGSIGVIMEWTNYGDLLRWAKLKPVVLHAGDLKDAGDPTRDLTPREQEYFQGLINNMYGQFIHDVAHGRNVPDDRIKPLATGQVWTGQQAKGLGLIDQEGGFRVALVDTARSVGITGEPSIKRPPKKKVGLLTALNGTDTDDLSRTPDASLLRILSAVSASAAGAPLNADTLNQSPGFYFLWK
ncbi:signal peptide peptidase SppA [Terriglobus aquaticus]|uniref:Signal peptide peptidase SppA n=1 Tax=Terriglobus aquaticus TaxID=940139 RepID=A0ABW9KIV7_9BACT